MLTSKYQNTIPDFFGTRPNVNREAMMNRRIEMKRSQPKLREYAVVSKLAERINKRVEEEEKKSEAQIKARLQNPFEVPTPKSTRQVDLDMIFGCKKKVKNPDETVKGVSKIVSEDFLIIFDSLNSVQTQTCRNRRKIIDQIGNDAVLTVSEPATPEAVPSEYSVMKLADKIKIITEMIMPSKE